MKKNPLNKRLFRELKQNTGRYIAISVILILAIMLLSGMLSETDAIKKTISDNREECLVEDGNFQSINGIDSDTLDKISKENNIDVYKNYYQDFEKIENPNGKDNDDATIRLYQTRSDINIQTYYEGREPKGTDEIALDKLFMENNDLKVGDDIKVASKEYKITGSISLPDYASLFKKNTDIIMDTFNFGVGIVSDDCFNTFDLQKSVCSYSFRMNDKDKDKQEKIDFNNKIKDSLINNKVMITGYLSAENNQSISFVNDDMGSDVPMMTNFVLLIVVIIAFVFAIVIASTVDSESNIIGTFLALGYKKREIVLHYLKMPIIVTTFAALIGNIIGYTVMPKVFEKLYCGSYCLSPIESVTINGNALLLSTVIPIIIMIIVNVIFLSYKMTLTPLKFLRNDLTRHKKKRGIKLPDFKFFNRFRIRIILQNKAGYIMLLVGILLGNLIMLFGLCMIPTIDKYLNDIKDTSASDYQYIIKNPVDVYSSSAEKFILESMQIRSPQINKDMDVSMYGVNQVSKYFDSIKLTLNDKDLVYVSEGFLKKYDKKINDTITLKDSNTGKSYDLTIKGTIKYDSGLAVFMNDKCLNELFNNDKDYYNGYLSNDELNIEDDNLLSKITVDDMQGAAKQMLKVFKGMTYIMILAAIIIFIALMYILTKIVIDKNALNISYLKVFGYNSKEISKLYIRATSIVVIICAIVSLPISVILLGQIFFSSMSKINGYVEAYVAWYHYLIMFVITILSYYSINFLHMKRINKIKMSDALKDRE